MDVNVLRKKKRSNESERVARSNSLTRDNHFFLTVDCHRYHFYNICRRCKIFFVYFMFAACFKYSTERKRVNEFECKPFNFFHRTTSTLCVGGFGRNTEIFFDE